MKPLLTIAILGCLLVISGCGVRGDLRHPEPAAEADTAS